MKDKEFLADAASLNFDATPAGGEVLEQIAAHLVGTPRHLAARAMQFLE